MCTIVVLYQPGRAWPLILGANRDERLDRPWRPPARHWPDRPGVVAGLDETAGGTWLGINDEGVVAAVANRRGALGPAPGMRSRGELPLRALDHSKAIAAARAIAALDGALWRPFNMVIADARAAFWLRRAERSSSIVCEALPAGISMVTAGERNDPASPRIRVHLDRFRAAPPPDPEAGDWRAWERLLASRETGAEATPQAAMTLEADDGFGTVSSALIALSADGRVVWRFASGPPDRAAFEPVTI